jgi:hypothetical protein
MSHFHGLIDFVGSHPLFAFVAVLLLALSEAVPVIGTVVPGSTRISLPPPDPPRLAPEPISQGGRAERTICAEARCRERFPGAFHSGCARLCSVGCGYPENVIPAFLCGECPIRPGVGTDSCLSWCIGGHGD